MLAVFLKTLPFLGLIGLGWLAARSRFFPDAVMPHFESITYPQPDQPSPMNHRCTTRVDVAAAMRDMWS